MEAGIRGQLEEIDRLIKSVNNSEITNARNLTQNEINRRLGIVQEISNGISKVKIAYDTSISKSLLVFNYFILGKK